MAMLECPGCKHIVDESTKRCGNCGYEVKKYFKQLAKEAKKSGRSVGENTIKLGSVYDSQTEASHLEAQLEFLRKPAAVAPEAPAQKPATAAPAYSAPETQSVVTPVAPAAPASSAAPSYAAPAASSAPSYASPAASSAPSYASPAASSAPSYASPAASSASSYTSAPAAAPASDPAPAAPTSSNPFMAANPIAGIGGSLFESPSLAQSKPADAAPASTIPTPSPAPSATVLPTSSPAPSSQAAVLPVSGSSSGTSGSGAATLPVGDAGNSQSFFVPGNDSNTSLPAPSQAAPERKPIAPNQPSMFQKPVYQDEPATPLVTSTPKPSTVGKFAGNRGGSLQKGLFESEALNQAHANGVFVESSATNATLEDARRAEEKKREEQESYNPYNRKAANNSTLADIPKFQQSASAANPVAANPLLQGGGFGVGTGAANIQRSSMIEKKEEEVIEGIFDSPLLNQRAKQIAAGEFVPTNVASDASLDALERKRQESVNYASFKRQAMVGKNFMTQIPENLIGKQQEEQAQLSNIDHPVNPFLADRNKPADELGIYGDRPRQ